MRATGRVASEAAQAQAQAQAHLGGAALLGKIPEPAVVAAMDPVQRALESRAGGDALWVGPR
jgi:hypothetical protein